MSDSLRTSGNFSRSNFNQDVARIVAEQGKLNYVRVLNTCFPARNITPLSYRKEHFVSRKVKCIFVGPADEIPTQCPSKYDLLAVIGLGFTRRDTEDVAELLENAQVGPKVILGVPQRPCQGTAQLKEISAMNYLASKKPYAGDEIAQDFIKKRISAVRVTLLDKLKEQLAPKNFKWIHQGKVFDEIVSGSRDVFFTAVLESLYYKAPLVGSCGNASERNEAVDILLDVRSPLQFVTFDDKGGIRVCRDLLLKNDILKVTQDHGSYLRCEVNNALPAQHSFAYIWNGLLKNLLGSGLEERKVSLAKLVRKFISVPYGLDVSHLSLFLAAALRLFYRDFYLQLGEDRLELSGENLRKAFKDCHRCEICYAPQTPYANVDYLQSIIKLFGQPKDNGRARDLWDLAKDSLLDWYDALSPLTKTFKPDDGSAAAALKLLLADNKESDSRQFIEKNLLANNGFAEYPDGEESEGLLNWLNIGKDSFRDYEEACRFSVACRIALQFGGDPRELPRDGYVERLNELFRHWFSCLHPQTGKQKVSEEAHALIEMYAQHPEADSDYWFGVLPQQLGLAPLLNWEGDYSVTFASRLARARLELELWHIERLFPQLREAKTAEEIEKLLSHWMRSVMNGANLNSEERSSILLDLLEQFSWSVDLEESNA
ncbi:hypothetical protein IJT10_05355 [bacterium]|nr:hypothetical protein [bacterium]